MFATRSYRHPLLRPEVCVQVLAAIMMFEDQVLMVLMGQYRIDDWAKSGAKGDLLDALV